MRLFLAIDVPDEIKDGIESSIVDALRPQVEGARWTRPEGRHLTLKFLGEVDDETIGDIEGVLADVAPNHRAFDAAFDDLGGFPSLRRPRVLWVGIGEGAEAMRALACDLDEGVQPLGFRPEDRSFHPHFTLARFPKPRIIGELPQIKVPAERFNVAEIVLFRSQLHPKGARYTALSTHALGA